MKGKVTKTLAFCLAGCMVLSLQGVQVMAAEEENSPEIGDLVFAQCEDYINIREEDSMDSEVVAKIYNNSAATIEGESGIGIKFIPVMRSVMLKRNTLPPVKRQMPLPRRWDMM